MTMEQITAAAGGRHKAFVALRLAGMNNKAVEEFVGNQPGTVAFAITALRKKHGIVGTRENNWGLEALAEALDIKPAEIG